MGQYENLYVRARNEYQHKIEKLASKKLLEIVKEDKPKQLAVNLDNLKSQAWDKMDAGLNVFEAYRLTYIKKINDQIAHESQPAPLRTLLHELSDHLEKIGDIYQKECDAKRKLAFQAEELKKEQEDDLKDDITKVTDEYKKRGDAYLSAAVKLEKEFVQLSKSVQTEANELKLKAVRLKDKTKPDPDKKKSFDKVQASYKKLKETWEKAEKSHQDLKDLRRDDGYLKPEDVAKEMRMQIPSTARADLEKIYRTNNKSFVRANQIMVDLDKKFEPESKMVNDTLKATSEVLKSVKPTLPT